MYMQGSQTGGYSGVGGGFPGFPGGGGGSGFPGGPGGFPGGGGGPPGGPAGGFAGGPFMGSGFPGGGPGSGTNPGGGGGGFMGGGPGPGSMNQVGNMGQFGGGPMGGGPMGGPGHPGSNLGPGGPPGGGIFGSQFGQPGSDILPGAGGFGGGGPGGGGGGGQFQRGGPGGPGGGPGGPGGPGGGGGGGGFGCGSGGPGGPGRGGKGGKPGRREKGGKGMEGAGMMPGGRGQPPNDQFGLDMGPMGGGFGGGGPYAGKGQQALGNYGSGGPQQGGPGFGGCGGMPGGGPSSIQGGPGGADGGGRGKGGRGGGMPYAGGGAGKGGPGGPGRGGGGGQLGAAAAQSQGLNHSNLFIGNLPEDASDSLLREAFDAYGNVMSCRVFTRNGRTCALVKMGSVQEAEAACRGVSRSLGGDQKSRWLVKFADSDVGGTGPGLGLGGGKGGCPGGKAGFGDWGKGGPGGPGQMGLWPGAKGGKGPAGQMPGGSLGWAPGKGAGGPGGPGRRREREQPDATPTDNLYVKGLPPRITEAQLNRTFSKAGKVVELKILRYGDSLECAALVRMATVEAAKTAIESLNGTAPEGAVPPLTIRYHGKDPTAASDNLYVKGLPLNFTQDHLHLLFGQYGTMRRSRVLQPPASRDQQAIAGEEEPLDIAALVQMSSAEEAARVIQMLNGRVPDGVGPQMTIRYAEPKAGGKTNEQTPSDNLYVKGLPLGTPDFLLRAVFDQFGTVVRLKVLEPRGGEAMDCAALVQMSNVAEAQASVEALHGRVLAAPLPPMRVRFAGKDQQPGANLYVAGLPPPIHEQQLRTTFAQCGTVVRLRLLVQPGRPETHALVQMHSQEEAEAAIAKLHGQPPESLGPTLVVRYATNQNKEEKEAKKEEKSPADLASIEASLEALQMKP